MCNYESSSTSAMRDKTPQDQLAELLYRDLRLPYPLLAEDVRSMIFARWETLKTLAHAIHEQDRRKRSRDRRA